MEQLSATLLFTVFGGDMRQNYLANFLSEKGHTVTCFLTPPLPLLHPHIRQASSLNEALSASDIIIGPVPFTRDQKTVNISINDRILLSDLYSLLTKKHFLIGANLPSSFLDLCHDKQISCYDFMQSESLMYTNAELTAEGMIREILDKTPFAVQNCPVLVIGYGRCGTVLTHKLNALGCNVSVCEVSESRRALASAFGFQTFSPARLQSFLPLFSVIVNTAPQPVLMGDSLSALTSSCFLFDLASPPGGIDAQAAAGQNLPLFQCLGLPGKTAPLSAGEAIGINILERIAANV